MKYAEKNGKEKRFLMDSLHELVELPKEIRVSRGIEYTPREIESQPRIWVKNFEIDPLLSQRFYVIDVQELSFQALGHRISSAYPLRIFLENDGK